jgi:hypothetical protein
MSKRITTCYAIETPCGRLILETVRKTTRRAWIAAGNELDGWYGNADNYIAQGYRAVRVTVAKAERVEK